MCQVRLGSLSIAIMQLTETMVMPSTSAWPVAGNSGYVASPSMSDISSPLSATAPCTASSAWAASGISAERVTVEKPTPLTATLQRFSHMPLSLFVKHDLLRKPVPTFRDHALSGRRRIHQTKLRQRDVVVERLEDDLDPTSDLRLRIGRSEKIA